jgi:hypothetical protein
MAELALTIIMFLILLLLIAMCTGLVKITIIYHTGDSEDEQ